MTLSGYINLPIDVQVKINPQIYMGYNSKFYCEDPSVSILDGLGHYVTAPVTKFFNEVNWNTAQSLKVKSATPGTKTIKWENTSQYFVSGGAPFPGAMHPLKGSFDVVVSPTPPDTFIGSIPGGFTFYSGAAFKVPGDFKFIHGAVTLNEKFKVEKITTTGSNFNTGGVQGAFLAKITKPDSSVEYVGSTGASSDTTLTYVCDQLGAYLVELFCPFIYTLSGALASLPLSTWKVWRITPDDSVSVLTDTRTGVKEPGRIIQDLTQPSPVGTDFSQLFPGVLEENLPSALTLVLLSWDSYRSGVFPVTFSGTVNVAGMKALASGHWLTDSMHFTQANIRVSYNLTYGGVSYGITFDSTNGGLLVSS